MPLLDLTASPLQVSLGWNQIRLLALLSSHSTSHGSSTASWICYVWLWASVMESGAGTLSIPSLSKHEGVLHKSGGAGREDIVQCDWPNFALGKKPSSALQPMDIIHHCKGWLDVLLIYDCECSCFFIIYFMNSRSLGFIIKTEFLPVFLLSAPCTPPAFPTSLFLNSNWLARRSPWVIAWIWHLEEHLSNILLAWSKPVNHLCVHTLLFHKARG